MINLDIKTGELTFFNEKFNSKSLKEEIKKVNLMELWTSINGWETFRLKLNNYILIITFNKNIIESIELSLIKDDKKNNELKKVLKSIGGEKQYDWGRVSFVVDIKTPSTSVYILYPPHPHAFLGK